MGKTSKDKGYRGEHRCVEILNEMSIEAVRVPLSGAAPGTKGDITLKNGWVCEVKNQERINALFWEWLDGVDVLFIKRNRKPYLAIMRLEDWGEMWKKCER